MRIDTLTSTMGMHRTSW